MCHNLNLQFLLFLFVLFRLFIYPFFVFIFWLLWISSLAYPNLHGYKLKGLVVVVEEHSNYTLVFSLCCRPLAGYHLFVKTLGPLW
jgi:hypothetical protein